MAGRLALVVLAVAAFATSQAYYLPGVAPENYEKGDKIDLDVNALTSPRSVVPFDYYYSLFNFCKPTQSTPSRNSLGAILFGDRIYNSDFQLFMLKNTTCQRLCTVENNKDVTNFLIARIQERYLINWLIDNLPAARVTKDGEVKFYSVGFELGKHDESAAKYASSKPKLNNHYIIQVQYHPNSDEEGNTEYRVVGVIVYGVSRDYTLNAQGEPNCDELSKDKNASPLTLTWDSPKKVAYTYDVRFTYTEIEWGTRWDNYLHVYDPKIHWFSLINSFVIVIFLTFMVAMILVRALHKDISRYNSTDSQDEAQEEWGWKLVHGDVFRTPSHYMLLSVLSGNGVQMMTMSFVTLVLALFGFLSPASRGSLMTVAIVFYVCLAFLAGYVSARLYKMFGGEQWKLNVGLTAFVVPGAIVVVFIFLNFFLIATHSSAAVPFTTLLGVLALWLLVSAPLCFVGAYFGFKNERIEQPVRTNQIPRQIPSQVFYLRPLPSILLGGILPFGAIFIELYFILNSIWFNRIYYVFGFLFLVFIILAVTCSEVTILMCYFHLCSEDYHWWWRSFLTSGCTAFYMLLYAIVYYYTQLEFADGISTILYFGWTLVMCMLVFVVTGTIGFLACLWFVRRIFASTTNK